MLFNFFNTGDYNRIRKTFDYDNLHTQHNLPLQPFNQEYNLISHAIYVVCVDFYT